MAVDSSRQERGRHSHGDGLIIPSHNHSPFIIPPSPYHHPAPSSSLSLSLSFLMSSPTSVLVLGGTGQVASEVVRLLVTNAVPVTALVRSLTKAQTLLPPQAHLVQADWTDSAALTAAVTSSRARKAFVYYDALKAGTLDSLRSAGIQHLVLLSTNLVGLDLPSDNAIALSARTLEKSIQDMAFTYTFLRADSFFSNAFWWRSSIAKEGVVSSAYPDSPIPHVAIEDIAEVAVQALSGHSLDNVAVNVVGPHPISHRQMVAAVSSLLGKPISVVSLTEDAYLADHHTLPRSIAQAALQYQKFRQEKGSDVSAKADSTVIGKMSFQQFIARHQEAFNADTALSGH